MHPLDGARLKIIRAKHHVQLFRAKTARHLRKYTSESVTEIDGDKVEQTHTLLIPFPEIYSAIVGDALTNSRAGLDYVLWELASRYFDPPFNIKNRNDRMLISFPIDPDMRSKDYEDRLTGLENRKIPAAAISRIRSVYPRNAGYEPLGVLHKLVNLDKHRTIILTAVGRSGYLVIDTWNLPEPVLVEGLGMAIPLGGFNIRGNADGVTLTKGKTELNTQPQLFVAFSDPSMSSGAVDVTLDNIVKCVDGVIPMFDEFF